MRRTTISLAACFFMLLTASAVFVYEFAVTWKNIDRADSAITGNENDVETDVPFRVGSTKIRYSRFKNATVAALRLSKDAIHIYIGVVCLLASVVLLRRPLTSFWMLLPGLVISCAIEVIDCLESYLAFGHVRWGASLHDVVNTNLIPFLLVTLARWQWIKV